MISVEALARRIREIPPLPEVAVRLIQMSQDPKVAPRDLVQVIKYDPAITTKVLRLCNSPYYGLQRSVTSLQEAMVYIGTDALVNFVMAGCISSYCMDENEGYGLQRGELWRHSVGTAICSQKIAEKYARPCAPVAFTAGLLHDLGKMILNSFVAEDFSAILCLVEKYGFSFAEAEQKILGCTHAQLGAEIAEIWTLPAEFIDAIRYHHDPMDALSNRDLVAVVHIGDVMCMSFGIGVGLDGLAYRLNTVALESLHVDRNDLTLLAIDFHDAFKKAQESLLGIND